MIDTVACFRNVPPLEDALFDGGAVSMNFAERTKMVRLWKNPAVGEYAPRVTYWRNAEQGEEQSLAEDEQSDELPRLEDGEGLLKLEFSVAKMADCTWWENPTADQVDAVLNQASETAQVFVEDDYDVREWRAQRVDYAWMWDVEGYLPAYMSVLSQLRIGSWSRHPYDVSEGVVWKTSGTRGRWVKFYNKGKELGNGVEGILRFEVSNYREAVRYMADKWFECPRLVGELVNPVRAVYVMAYFWERLGLGRSEDYGTEELLERRLRDVFVERVAQATYVLHLYRKYGTAAIKSPLELVSKSMFYRYRRELVEHGFMTSLDDDATINVEYLDALHLPVQETLAKIISDENLGEVAARLATHTNKKFWENFRSEVGLSNAPSVGYFNDQVMEMLQ